MAYRRQYSGRRLLTAIGIALAATCPSPAAAAPPPLVIGHFSAQPIGDVLPPDWHLLTFKKIEAHTRYRLVSDNGTTVIRAHSRSAAAGLVRRIAVDPAVYSILEWRWKIQTVLPNGDVTRKSGDDYPARVYVTFIANPEQMGFWERARYRVATAVLGEAPPTAALNYIWANHAPVGTMVPNPFTDRAKMIIIQSGTAKAGTWQMERRNILADYKAAFGKAPPAISSICIMTDSDNTGGEAVAWYGDIRLLPEKALDQPKGPNLKE